STTVSPVHSTSDASTVGGLVRGCHVRQRWSVCPSTNAVYRDRISRSAVRAGRPSSTIGPQHVPNPSPLPHGHALIGPLRSPCDPIPSGYRRRTGRPPTRPAPPPDAARLPPAFPAVYP